MSGDRENKWKSCFCSLFLPFLCESGPALFPLKLSLKSTVTWWSLYLTDPSFSSRFRNAALTAVIFKTSSPLKVHSSPIFVFSLGSILLYILHYSHWAEMASVPLLAFFAGISFLYFCFFSLWPPTWWWASGLIDCSYFYVHYFTVFICLKLI